MDDIKKEIGNAYAENMPDDWPDCPKCGAMRFWPSGRCMQRCEEKPAPNKPVSDDLTVTEQLRALVAELGFSIDVVETSADPDRQVIIMDSHPRPKPYRTPPPIILAEGGSSLSYMAAMAVSGKRQPIYMDLEQPYMDLEFGGPSSVYLALPDVLSDVCIPINDKATCFNRKPSPPAVHHKNTKQAKQKAQRKARAINRR